MKRVSALLVLLFLLAGSMVLLSCGSGSTSSPVVTVTVTPTEPPTATPTPPEATDAATVEPTPEDTPTEEPSVFVSYPKLSKAVYMAKSRAIQYRVINKDADQLVGHLYKFTGQIVQIQDAGPGQYFTEFGDGLGRPEIQPETDFLLDVTKDEYGLYDDSVMILHPDGVRVYEKDVVSVWAECLGSYTYTSVAGWDVTVPLLWAKYIQKQ
jgi:hypothetical protein